MKQEKHLSKIYLLLVGAMVVGMVVISVSPLIMIKNYQSKIIEKSSEDLVSNIVTKSQVLMENLVSQAIIQKANDMAKQMRLLMAKNHGFLDVNGSEFREIAIQKVGKGGYTCVYDCKTAVMLAHPNSALVGKDMHFLKDELPDWWAIFGPSLDCVESNGFYNWKDSDGVVRRKYMSMMPVNSSNLMVAATIYLDEFNETKFIIQESGAQNLHSTKATLTSLANKMMFRTLIISIIFISVIGAFLCFFWRNFLKSLNRLIIGIGNCSAGVFKKMTSSECPGIGSILDSFNRVVETLIEAQQLKTQAAIGQSTAMVAHDVRKPLAGMKALLASLAHIKGDPEQVNKMILSVDRSITQTNTMLNDILEFSKDSTTLDKSDIDPLAVIISSLSDVFISFSSGNGNKPNITITYDLKHKNYLNVDGNRIVRVLVNIIGNAVEAMGGKGKIWVRTEDVVSSKVKGESSKHLLRMTVGNDGPVMSEDVQQKLFEPFFTKGKKGGSGLGLSITQKIIDMHEGKISVSSRQENGGNKTEFVIELAAKPANLAIKEEDLIHHSDEFKTFIEEEKLREEHGETENTVEFMRLHKAHGKKFHLLIVDDEPLFRETVRTLISSIHQIKDHVKIVEASSAEEGLSLFKAREFDYVITDIDMGKRNMNGYEMAEGILKKYSKTKVLIHSNKRRAEMDKEIRDIENTNFMGFLPKPMNQREVTQFLACRTFEAKKGVKMIEKRKNILVVNDDDEIQIMFKVLLKSRGVDILGASNVGDALKKLANNEFDVILADVNLGAGEPDGYELLKKIKEDRTTAKVYMVSGYSADEEWPKAKKLGADGYFQLPVDDAALKTILQ